MDATGFEFSEILCPTCEVDDAKVLGVRRRQTGEAVETTVVRCRRCGLLYPNPFPFPTGNVYDDPDSYFAAHDSEGKVRSGRVLLRELAQMAGGRRILDVGSGKGEMLAAAAEEGLEAKGIEISDDMARESERLHGIRPDVCTIEDYDAEPFDAIVLNGLIEHVHDPNTLMASVRRLIKPAGVVFIDTPREPHLLTMIGRAMGKTLNLSPTWEPYHVFGFNPRALDALLRKHGFRIERLKAHDCGAHAPGAASLVMKAANLTPWAANMWCWARAN